MKKNPFLPFTLGAAAFLLLSCGMAVKVKHPYTLSEQYAAADLSHRKLVVVMPGDSNIVINNKKDVVKNYGGQNASPESRIRKFYYPLFFQTLKTFTSGDSVVLLDDCRPGLVWDTPGARDIVLRSDLDSMESASHYRVPEKARLDTAGLDSAVILIIERLEFRRNNLQIEYYWDDKTRKPAHLQADAKVLIWDFAADAPVFYGTVTERTVFQFGMQRKHWDESAQNLAKKIVVLAKCL